ncbi:putative membrane protein [Mycolicibacterium chubuense NBB4]|uniref:Putative membrane protein n=1 Tax=Mycolicibacterium chubuense (strain NBB4) TaxID=710421 RepID=I4BLJ0_MYCCN|nr:DUF2231 domain-containing protein [Mycolicibacterium chubuense]AFM18147.1 putative membrane protein [Mycolicibacterium chubuense NBB4]
MSTRAGQAKHPVSAMLAGPYGHPFHPILVTVPIGAWAAGLVFDIASHVVGDPGFLVRGAHWLIAIGVIGAAAAAVVGFLDLLAIPTGTRAFTVALAHMTLNLVVTAAYIVNFLWRQSLSVDSPVRAGPLALSVVSFAVLGASGYLGGMLSYRYGVRVADEATQEDGFAGR